MIAQQTIGLRRIFNRCWPLDDVLRTKAAAPDVFDNGEPVGDFPVRGSQYEDAFRFRQPPGRELHVFVSACLVYQPRPVMGMGVQLFERIPVVTPLSCRLPKN